MRPRPSIRALAAGLCAMLLAAAPAPAAPAASPDAAATSARATRLLYAEALAPRWEGAPSAHAAGSGATRGTLRFRAFGRGFELELAPNSRLGQAPPGVMLLAGSVPGIPGSWARLMRQGDALTGLVYDGADYFGIEPVANLVTVLDPDVPQPATGSMVYRLADLLVDPRALACGTDEATLPGDAAPAVNAAMALQALASELAAEAATNPAYRIHIAPVADHEFASRFGANAISELLARLNIADGIFSSQVGVDLMADAPTVFTSTSYPLTATTPDGLLDQLSDYRVTSGTSAGITHLFTNKSFANNVVGIAWRSAVCLGREGASLSSSAGMSTVTSGLVVAHELGHNFGAYHDGEAGKPCESTPQTYLMAPRNAGSSTFSPCSLQYMTVVIAERSLAYPACLTSIIDFDVALAQPAAVHVDPGATVELPLRVQNLGQQPASTLNLRVQVPAPLQVTDAIPDKGYCDFDATQVSCDLASLTANGSWDLRLQVTGTEERSYAISASVSAAVDGSPGNNSRSFTLTVGNPQAATTGSSGGGGGGGGTADALSLLGLLGLALRRRRRAASRTV